MTSPAPLSLRYRAVGHQFGPRRLFAGLEAEFGAGDVIAVLGANGAGKSTLLRITAGLVRPTHGAVQLWRGPTLLDDAARRAAIGYAGPDTWPYRALTVAENLEFFAHLRGVPVDPELVALVGLEDRLGQLVSELSTGYVQRLRLALATLHRPSVLLLDEPGANLDATGHAVVAAVIAAQRERGPCLLAANDPRDIAHGNRIIELGG